MANLNCNCKCTCTVAALIASAIIGVLTAFLQITGTVVLAPVFLWVAFGIAVAYLGILLMTSGVADPAEGRGCLCSTVNTLLAGLLGTLLLSAILLAVGIIATSVINAILVGLLLFFLVLTLTSSACLIQGRSRCDD